MYVSCFGQCLPVGCNTQIVGYAKKNSRDIVVIGAMFSIKGGGNQLHFHQQKQPEGVWYNLQLDICMLRHFEFSYAILLDHFKAIYTLS